MYVSRSLDIEELQKKLSEIIRDKAKKTDVVKLCKTIYEACTKSCIENIVKMTMSDHLELRRARQSTLMNTACFRRTAIITDSCNIEAALLVIDKITIRGGIVIAMIDLKNKIDILTDIPIIEPDTLNLTESIQKSITVSEIIERPVILRIPLFLDFYAGESAECRVREECYFNRNWKLKSAWTSAGMCLKEEFTIDEEKISLRSVIERALDYKVKGSSKVIIIDRSIYNILSGLENYLKDIDIIIVNMFNRDILSSILSILRAKSYKNIDFVSVYGCLMREFVKVLYDDGLLVNFCDLSYDVDTVRDNLSRMMKVFSEDETLLSSIVYKLLDIFRNYNFVIVSTLRSYVEVSRGYYDTRMVLVIPSSPRDIADIEVEYCDPISLSVLAESLPPGVNVVCVERDIVRFSLRDALSLRSLRGTHVIGIVREDEVGFVCNLLKMLNVRYCVVKVSNDVVYEISKCIDSDSRVILVLKPLGYDIVVDNEYCDRCGECLKAGCGAVSLSEHGVMLRQDSCLGCLACVVLCTRGAIRLSSR